MPLLVHPVARALGVHGEAVELAREAHREVGDVDALLHLAEALGIDLAHLAADDLAELRLARAEGLAHQAHDLAALGGGQHGPLVLHGLRGLHGALVVLGGVELHGAEHLAGGGLEAVDGLALGKERRGLGAGCEEARVARDSEPLEEVVGQGEGRIGPGKEHGAGLVAPRRGVRCRRCVLSPSWARPGRREQRPEQQAQWVQQERSAQPAPRPSRRPSSSPRWRSRSPRPWSW